MTLNPMGRYPFDRTGAMTLARDLGLALAAFFRGTWSAPRRRPLPGRRKARRMAARGY